MTGPRPHQPQVLLGVAVLLVMATACATAATPSAPASGEAFPSVAPTPEPTPELTPEPEPSEEVGACMDPETHELLMTTDNQTWTAEDRELLATAVEAYDFSELEPGLRERAERWAENFVPALRRGDPASIYGFLPTVRVGDFPIVACN